MSLRTIKYATNTYKNYFYTFRINRISCTYGQRKEKRPNPYGMFSQNLPISVAFSAILKKRGYHNATQAALIGAKGKIKTGDDSAADLKCLKAG